MIIDTLTCTYLRAGGLTPFSYIGALLTMRLQEFGSTLSSIELYPRLALPAGSEPVSDDYFDEWKKQLEKLPYIVFKRKSHRMEIAFRSQHFDAADMDDWQITPEQIHLAGEEIAEALYLVRKRIKSTDDFNVDHFLSDVSLVLKTPIDSMDEWNRILNSAHERQQAEYAAMSPWDQLDIDWDEFHPKARKILDDPFYWDCVDDIAPHGNDTGSDLLADFMEWNKRNSKKSPLSFVVKRLKGEGIEPIDWSVTNQEEVLKLDKELSIEMGICNESAIALAFAVLKMRGSCPADAAELAKCALERTSILVKASSLNEQIKAEWDVGINRMKSKLVSSQSSTTLS